MDKNEFMSMREVFDKVKNHLLTQNCKSVSMSTDDDVCVYRSSNGMTCAIGCLIGEEDYDPNIEEGALFKDPNALGNAIYKGSAIYKNKCILLKELLLKSKVDVNDAITVDMLKELQYIHDSCEVDSWDAYISNLENYYFNDTNT